MITELNDRAQSILRFIVDTYMETGEPVGSRTISKYLGMNLSPATIRNVMADLEIGGLLHAPHTSAGRLPTQAGLRLYIDGLMQIGNLSEDERAAIDAECRAAGQALPSMLEKAGSILSGLSASAGVVVAPKTERPLRQIQFVPLDAGRLLVVLVMQDGTVENRVMAVAEDLPFTTLAAASNYLTERLGGSTLSEARGRILNEIKENRAQLDRLTADLVAQGLALTPPDHSGSHIIIRGQSKLLRDVKAVEDIERARLLLESLEEQQTMSSLLHAAQEAQGIRIFIGSENRMFDHSGWSMVIAPYRSQESQIVGAIGVIGPMRLNYSRIIPLVDYTAQVMERLLTSKS